MILTLLGLVLSISTAPLLAAEGEEAEEESERVEELPSDVQTSSQEDVEKESEKPLAAPILIKKIGRDVVRGPNVRFALGTILFVGADGARVIPGFSQGFLLGYDYKNSFGVRAHFLTSVESATGLLSDEARRENISMRTFVTKADVQYFFTITPKNFIYPFGGGGVYWNHPQAEGTWKYSPMLGAGFGHEFMPRLEGLSVGYEASLAST